MTIDKSRYPTNWNAISLDIRTNRAGNRCEQCSVPNGALIVRKPKSDDYLIVDYEGECLYHRPDGSWIRLSELPDGFDYDREIKVVLTVHHIGIDHADGRPGNPHDKMDVRPENLIALCQKCHFSADKDIHIANRKKTIARKKAEKTAAQGQLSLFGDAS